MFESFFPRPKWLVISAILWAIFTVFVWYSFGDAIGGALGFEFAPDDAAPIIGLGYFVTDEFLWFYLYFLAICAAFLCCVVSLIASSLAMVVTCRLHDHPILNLFQRSGLGCYQ